MNTPAPLSTNVIVIRHAQQNAGFSEDRDPGLSAVGEEQGAACADTLARVVADLGVASDRIAVVASPLKRTQITARYTMKRLGIEELKIDERSREIPSPPDVPLHGRSEWLRFVMQRTWNDAPLDLLEWRDGIRHMLSDHAANPSADLTLVFSHFMVINTIFHIAKNDMRIMSRRPNHCSYMKLHATRSQLDILSEPEEFETEVA